MHNSARTQKRPQAFGTCRKNISSDDEHHSQSVPLRATSARIALEDTGLYLSHSSRPVPEESRHVSHSKQKIRKTNFTWRTKYLLWVLYNPRWPRLHLSPSARIVFDGVCVSPNSSCSLSVSKQMYKEAFEVFFSDATFEFHSDPDDAIQVLKSLPRRALSFLRNSHFCIVNLKFSSGMENEYTEKWKNAVSFIKENLDVSRLSIVIGTKRNYEGHTKTWFQNEIDSIYDIYCSIIGPLCTLPNHGHIGYNNGRFIDLRPPSTKKDTAERYPEKRSIKLWTVSYSNSRLKVPLWWYQMVLTNLSTSQ